VAKKRGRADEAGEEEQNSSGGAIPDMSSVNFPTTNDDSKATKDASLYDVDILQWVAELSTEKHSVLKDLVNLNLKYFTADNTLRKYAILIPEMEALEVHQAK
jgi:hypothetical protein